MRILEEWEPRTDGERRSRKTPGTEHGPSAWHCEGAQAVGEDKSSTQSPGPGLQEPAQRSV